MAAHAEVIRQAWMAQGRPSFAPDAPLTVSARFYIERPPSHYRAGRNGHLLKDSAPVDVIGKPDASNLLKLLEDALNGCLWPDDSQIVCFAGVHKIYVTSEPRTEMDVWEAT